MKTKRWLSLLLVMLVIMLALPAQVLAEDKVKLFYYGWTDEESYMTAIIEAFEAANPDIDIEASFVNHADHNDRLVVMASANAADFDLMSLDSYSFLRSIVAVNGLMPLSDMIKANNLDMSAYGPTMADMKYQDVYYGLPYRSTLYSLYYNKDMFDKAGLPYPTKITWDEYLELAKKLTNVQDGTQYWGSFIAEWLGSPLSIFELNSNLLDDDITPILKWFKMWNQSANVDKSQMSFAEITANSVDWMKLFCTGTVAMLPNGEWTISMIKDNIAKGVNVPNWDVTYLPNYDVSDDIVSPGGLSTFIGVGANTKYPEQAFRFAKYVASEESGVLLAEKGVLPAYSSDAVKASFVKAVGVPGASTLLDTVIALEAPPVDGYSEVQTILSEEKVVYMTGQETIEELEENFRTRREEVLATYR